jgi:uncharacterized protein YjbI with pentapeptide repeats
MDRNSNAITSRFAFALLSLVVCGGIASAPALGDAKVPGTAPARGNSDVPPKSCPSCSFVGVDWSNQDLTDVNLQGADLTGANLSGANMSGAELSGANLTNANLSNAVLNHSANGEADLSSANLSGAIFTGAQMLGTDLEYTDLSGTNFTATDLSRARLGPAPRTGLHVGRKTSFRAAQLPAGVHLDEKTSDSAGVRIAAAPTPSSKANGLLVDCGSSDLSVLSSAIYVAPSGQDTDTCGSTLATACATIAQGLGQCASTGCGVLVGYGVYAQQASLILRDSVSLFGGCVPKGKNSAGLRSRIVAPPGGIPAVDAVYVNSPTRLENFKISGSSTSVASAPSTAFRVRYSKGVLILVDTQVYASSGGAGNPGDNGKGITWNQPGDMCSAPGGVASTDAVGSFVGSTWTAGADGGVGGSGGNNGSPGKTICNKLVNGGTGGTGGRQGGGSFAVVAVGAKLQFANSRVIGGRGGNGGIGGDGGTAAKNAFTAICGGAGGAGGNGGPSIGIALIGSAVVQGQGPAFYQGVGGQGGRGGRYCGKSAAGYSGTATDQQTF